MKLTRIIFLVCCLLAFRQFLQATPSSGYVIEWGNMNALTGIAQPAKLVVSNAVDISAGRLHCLALKADGTVVAWSWNYRGEPTFDNTLLTTGSGFSSNTPTTNKTTIMTNGVATINGQILSDVTSIAAADGFSLALKKNGMVVTSGGNYVPAELANITAIVAEWGCSWALKSDGTVVGWPSERSNPSYGQLFSVENLSNVVAIAVGPGGYNTRGVALKKDSTVGIWGGESTDKEATPPTGLSNVIAIAAGSSHSLAVKNDGTVIGWGFNDVGQATGVPTTNSPNVSAGQVTLEGQVLSNVVSVAANRGYSMALKQDGTVIAWGRMANNQYPATIPVGLSNVVAIAAGENYCLAITTNSAVAEKFQPK